MTIRREDEVSFSDRISEPNEPTHRSVVESLQYMWGHGGKKLLVAWATFLVVALISGVVAGWSLFRGIEQQALHPYEVSIPVQVLDRVEGVDGPATNTGAITASIEGCNTTDGVIVLNFTGQWVKFNRGEEDGVYSPSHLVPLSPIMGVTARPGGALCGESLPVEVQLDLPEPVQMEGGLWQVSVQVDVYGCEQVTETEFGGMQCLRPTAPIDHMGWYSERFKVIP